MRTKIAITDTYYEAMTLRNELEDKYPDKIFQIRRINKGTNFMVSERVYTKSKKDKKHGDSI
jgi:hypothetical protein